MEYVDLVVSIVEQVIDEVAAERQPMKEVNNPQHVQIGKDKYHLDSIPAEKMAEFKAKILHQNHHIDSLSPEERANRIGQFKKSENERADKDKEEVKELSKAS